MNPIDLLTPDERAHAADIDARDTNSPVHCYDREGNPTTLGVWAMLQGYHPEYKIVEQTQDGDVLVSTVWLGLDHSFPLPGHPRIPIIFETMIFGGSEDGFQERYATEEQARKGHRNAVWLALQAAVQERKATQ